MASLNAGVLPPAIPRKDGQGVVTVTADVDPAVISGDEANTIPVNSIRDYPLSGRSNADGWQSV